MDERDGRIVSAKAVKWVTQRHGDGYEVRRRALSAAAGDSGLGCSLYELPPGKRDFPYHLHHGNDEAIFVLEGSGTLRLSGAQHRLEAHDYVTLPRGPDAAHQVVNTSNGVLRFLVMSTMRSPDVMEYPESDKVGAMAGSPPGGPKSGRWVGAFFPNHAAVDYWEGE